MELDGSSDVAAGGASALDAWGGGDAGGEFAFLDGDQVKPVPPERLRPHFSNRAAWRTRGPRRHLRPAVVHIAERRENVARPRERRPSTRRRTASRDGPGRSDPDDEPNDVGGTWRGLTAASVRMVQHAERRRSKWSVA